VLLATVLPAIFFLIRWEIEGVALAVALSHLIGVIYNLYQVNTILPGTVKSTLKIAVPILCNGIGMALVVQWAKTPVAAFFGDLFNLRALFSLMGIGAVVYLTLSFLTQRNLMREISQILLTLLPAKLGMQRSSVTTKV
jgi:hypothetical protein